LGFDIRVVDELKEILIVVEIAVVDNGGVEPFSIVMDYLICFLAAISCLLGIHFVDMLSADQINETIAP
jgi:hypothetical protein